MRNPFRRKSLNIDPAVVEAIQDREWSPIPPLGGRNPYQRAIHEAFQRGQGCSYSWMYAHQPAVRSVVEYIARNVAQLPLKMYERVSDTERERLDDDPAMQLMDRPGPPGRSPTGRQFVFDLVADWLVHDNAYVLKFEQGGGSVGIKKSRSLVRLPPPSVTTSGGRFWPDNYRIWRIDGTSFDVQPEDILHWKGYNPEDQLVGVSKLETLRRELAGDLASQETVQQLLESGLRGGYIKRPLDAPEWDEEGMKRFQEGWTAALKASPKKTPVLDEGMEFENQLVTPKDAQLLASREFTREEVASIYGVPVAVVNGTGSLGDARAEVYADVLPPITTSLGEQLDLDILEGLFGYSQGRFYFEFDLSEKLRGDLENRFPAMTAAAGRPWITVNEIRARENLPPEKDGDKLTIPLNVQLQGDPPPAQPGSSPTPQLPAPNVMPIQQPGKPPQDGSHRTGTGAFPLASPSGKSGSEEIRAIENGNRAVLPVKADSSAQVTDVLLSFYRRYESLVAAGKDINTERLSGDLQKSLVAIVGPNPQVEIKARGLVEIIDGMLSDGAARDKVFARARKSAPEIATMLSEALADTPRENIEELKALGVPEEMLWEQAGFSQTQIDRMMAMRYADSLIESVKDYNPHQPRGPDGRWIPELHLSTGQEGHSRVLKPIDGLDLIDHAWVRSHEPDEHTATDPRHSRRNIERRAAVADTGARGTLKDIAGDVRAAKDDHEARIKAEEGLKVAADDINGTLPIKKPGPADDIKNYIASVIQLIHDALQQVSVRLAAEFQRKYGHLVTRLRHWLGERGDDMADDLDTVDGVLGFIHEHAVPIHSGLRALTKLPPVAASAMGMMSDDEIENQDIDLGGLAPA